MRPAHAVALTLVSLVLFGTPSTGAEDNGRFAKWSTIEFAFTGPASTGRGPANPFSIRLDVTFAAPSGRQIGEAFGATPVWSHLEPFIATPLFAYPRPNKH